MDIHSEFQALLILMVVVWVAGKIFRHLKLPVIFGELLGGFIIGPAVFNIIDPGSNFIQILAELGVFFLMLHAGLEADPEKLYKSSKKATLIAVIGILFPFTAVFLVSHAFGLPISQSLFLALGLSAPAIAIAVRIFKDFNLSKSKVSDIVLSSAVISDIIILVMFSVIISFIETGSVAPAEIFTMTLKIAVFFLFIVFGGQILKKYAHRFFKDKGFTLTLIIALAFGLIAEKLGLHMIIGAFMAGLFIREELLEDHIYHKIEDRFFGLGYGFLGPIFFTSLAFNLDFSAVTQAPLFLLALLSTAFIAKFLGSYIAARSQKISAKKSKMISLALNSRGVVDLIIASIGLKRGIIDETLFSILVIIIFSATLISIVSIGGFRKFCHIEK